ncbi:hypothetical protein [Ekhidna sp.]|uniref:hypothetical protein n=1 Tax=Ekhidna sp. TaxID=2608089 RepID=UPI003515B5CD
MISFSQKSNNNVSICLNKSISGIDETEFVAEDYKKLKKSSYVISSTTKPFVSGWSLGSSLPEDYRKLQEYYSFSLMPEKINFNILKEGLPEEIKMILSRIVSEQYQKYFISPAISDQFVEELYTSLINCSKNLKNDKPILRVEFRVPFNDKENDNKPRKVRQIFKYLSLVSFEDEGGNKFIRIVDHAGIYKFSSIVSIQEGIETIGKTYDEQKEMERNNFDRILDSIDEYVIDFELENGSHTYPLKTLTLVD